MLSVYEQERRENLNGLNRSIQNAMYAADAAIPKNS
jgi:hypothetical protein